MRTRFLIVPALIALTAGCDGKFGYEYEQEDSFEVTEEVHTVILDGGAGDNYVLGGQYDTVQVTRRAQWRGDTPEVDAYVQDGVLYLSDGCEGWGWCEVDHEIILPADVDLNLRVGSGDMELNTINGDVRLNTGSGDVYLNQVTGALDVEVGSGDIEGGALALTSFYGQTGSGDVNLRYTQAPDLVDLRTGSGDVMLDLPEANYALDLDTGSGDIMLNNVQDNTGSEKLLRVSTGSGDISILGW